MTRDWLHPWEIWTEPYKVVLGGLGNCQVSLIHPWLSSNSNCLLPFQSSRSPAFLTAHIKFRHTNFDFELSPCLIIGAFLSYQCPKDRRSGLFFRPPKCTTGWVRSAAATMLRESEFKVMGGSSCNEPLERQAITSCVSAEQRTAVCHLPASHCAGR